MAENIVAVRTTELAKGGFLADPHGASGTKITNFNRVEFRFALGTLFDRRCILSKPEAETDENYKQLIPGAVFTKHGKVLSYRRERDLSKYTEPRLAGKTTVIIGGHWRDSDGAASDGTDHAYTKYLACLLREIDEEAKVKVDGQEESKESAAERLRTLITNAPVYGLDYNGDAVSRVHYGLVSLVALPPGWTVEMRDGAESERFEYVEPKALLDMNAKGQVMLEKWAEIAVMRTVVPFIESQQARQVQQQA
jgi:predicted NUDIX family phosphoesterase